MQTLVVGNNAIMCHLGASYERTGRQTELTRSYRLDYIVKGGKQQFPRHAIFLDLSELSIHLLPIQYHIQTWHVSP